MADTTVTSPEITTLEEQLRIAELNKSIREANEWTYDRQVQILDSQAKDTSNQQNFTDIFKQQASINQSLIDVLNKTGQSADQTPTYVTASMPAQQDTAASKPNYILYIAAAAAVYFFFIKGRKK